MIVCHCHGVSDRAIRRAVREGAIDATDVGRSCGAGTGCGGCVETIHEILHLETHTREQDGATPLLVVSPAV